MNDETIMRELQSGLMASIRAVCPRRIVQGYDF